MISPEDKAYILERAYVPEHILNLMVPISGKNMVRYYPSSEKSAQR